MSSSQGEEAATTLTALVGTLLPFGYPGFPATEARTIVGRINDLYALDKSPQFVGSLASFSAVSAFADASPQLLELERAQIAGADVAGLAMRDAAAFRAAALPPARTFEQLGPHERLVYLKLWQQSAFNVRRRFYTSTRAVAFIALYSMSEIWPSIGYAGPLLTTRPR